jgi:hypothetical protein
MPGSSMKFIVISVVALALTAAAFGQGGATCAITGTVQDPSGAVVAKAEVRITDQDTSILQRTVTTQTD